MRQARVMAAEADIEEQVNDVNMLRQQLPLEGRAGRSTTNIGNRVDGCM